jgi:hypothetical protein
MPRNICWSIFAWPDKPSATMAMSLNLIASALITIWIVEYFGYHAGENIHFLLLAGALIFIARLCMLIPIRRRTV